MNRFIMLSVFFSLFIAALSYSAGPYTDNSDGTVTDNGTGLVWTKCGTDSSGVLLNYASNCANASQGQRTWAQALNDCKALADNNTTLDDGSVAGDWRLPNINEMLTLVDTTRYTPVINDSVFPTLTSIYYVTSTTYINDPTKPYYFSVNQGGSVGYGIAKTSTFGYVRCVRNQ